MTRWVLRPGRRAMTRLGHGHRSLRPNATPVEAGRVEAPEKWRTPLRREGELPPVVALGKFDAMHRGHRALATVASEMGHPWLVSFSNMAAVMGWDTNRLPLVAEAERGLVLGKWRDACRGRQPHLRYLPFAEIRRFSPRAFVRMLVEELGVAGVVSGVNYRFGYKAAGDAALLQELATEFGIEARVVDLVSTDNGTGESVSSSKVRSALAAGDMDSVQSFLGRPYALRLDRGSVTERLLPASRFLNQPPRPGRYRVAVNNVPTSIQLLERGLLLNAESATSQMEEVVRLVFQ